ncbi:MAG TPA: NADPH:quinone reductase [Nevskiaceae bacterium]
MTAQRMKAVRVRAFGGPEQLHCEKVPVPAPRSGQVLVAIHAVGVNPVDTYILGGSHAIRPELPYTPGTDAAGTVAALGEGVSGLAVGERVYLAGALSGTYAEYALCGRDQVFVLPANASFAQGAALGVPCATAWRALFRRGGATAGETVLVHGATGSVGLAAVQLARAAGLRVLATGGSERGRAWVGQHGAHAVFDHHAADYAEQIKAQGGGIDLIVEMLANVNLDRDLQLLARCGRVVVVGNRGRIEINPRDLMRREADIRGVQVFAATDKEQRSAHAGLQAALANGTLVPLIGRRFTLEDAPEAHIAAVEPGHLGKVVMMTAADDA